MKSRLSRARALLAELLDDGRSHVMPDLNLLRDLGDEVRPPSLDSLRETARRRNRPRAAAVHRHGVRRCPLLPVIASGALLWPRRWGRALGPRACLEIPASDSEPRTAHLRSPPHATSPTPR